MIDPLDRLTAQLLGRLAVEVERGPSLPGTFRVGGIVKLGGSLERVLSGALDVLAAGSGRTSAELLADARGAGSRMDMASGGQLAMVLRKSSGLSGAADRRISLIVRDLTARSSAVQRVIDLRNDVAHDRELGPGVDAALAALRTLILAQRQAAGWAPLPG
jgi:hypothetical protein